MYTFFIVSTILIALSLVFSMALATILEAVLAIVEYSIVSKKNQAFLSKIKKDCLIKTKSAQKWNARDPFLVICLYPIIEC